MVRAVKSNVGGTTARARSVPAAAAGAEAAGVVSAAAEPPSGVEHPATARTAVSASGRKRDVVADLSGC